MSIAEMLNKDVRVRRCEIFNNLDTAEYRMLLVTHTIQNGSSVASVAFNKNKSRIYMCNRFDLFALICFFVFSFISSKLK